MLLAIIILLPLAAAMTLLAVPKEQTLAIKRMVLAISVIVFALSLGLVSGFDSSQAGWQFELDLLWIKSPEIHFHTGLDGLSLWLIVLTTFLMPLSLLASWHSVHANEKAFYLLFLTLETGMLGVFAALDLFLFYVFWEVSLIPMYFIIGVWGHGRRIYSAVKFFLFTMAGSVLMLVAIVVLYRAAHTFDIGQLIQALQTAQPGGQALFTSAEQGLLFLAFFVAFAIKVPLFPFHTWLPDAHVDAPTAGSVILAGVLLKMGTYGIVRFCLPMFPEASREYAPAIAALAIVGIIYGALVALVQTDMKKLVAYSSVSHMGFVVLGIFSFTQVGLDGAIYQMLNHGISTGGLFLMVGMLYDRRHTRLIADFGGIATPVPVISSFFLFITLSSIGLPILNGFVGEFLILLGASQAKFAWAVLGATGVILSAGYMLWMYQRVFFGEVTHAENSAMPDLDGREKWILAPICGLALWMGIAPPMFLKPMAATTQKLLREAGSGVVRVENRAPGAPRKPALRRSANDAVPGRQPAVSNE